MFEHDLVVLSHLRWTWVWQRPQHLISRIGAGQRVLFVEEPEPSLVVAPRVRIEEAGPVTRLWLEVPSTEPHVGFDDAYAGLYPDAIRAALGHDGARAVWLYTPMALPIAHALEPSTLVYDVMDDLASFKGAPRELQLRQQQALREADVVFTGGRSIHRGVVKHRSSGTHLFPSGVEPEHYAAAIDLREERTRPVAGYVGVIDERLDLDLVAGLADRLPDWDIQMVGPVCKIDDADLPRRDNLLYPGGQPYDALPRIMGGFDVALMPFAMNEATRSISPTKTLEYLAAGLPVVSTPVPDVVADYAAVVDLQDDADGFADACHRVLGHDKAQRAEQVRPILHRQHWDTIASRMLEIIGATVVDTVPVEAGASVAATGRGLA